MAKFGGRSGSGGGRTNGNGAGRRGKTMAVRNIPSSVHVRKKLAELKSQKARKSK